MSRCRLRRIFGLAAATMLLAVLLHLLIFHLLTASDAPPHRKDTEYKIKHIEKCPDVGFFFDREATPNSLGPDTCYLCFCEGDHTAICWKRDNRRCNKESFHYHGVEKRDKRSLGFTDIFFRDASRDYFNKNAKTQCKPYESSFSDDCPPADWCTGCTVCDCDANGRWDCHLLSFCPDDTKKSKRKELPPIPKSWMPVKEKTQEKLNNKFPVPKPKTRTNPTTTSKSTKKSKNKGISQIKRGGKKPISQLKRVVKNIIPLKSDKKIQPGRMKTPIKYKRIAHKKTNSEDEMIIKKNVTARKPVQINKSAKAKLEMAIARKMMKKVTQNLRKSVSAQMKNISEIARKHAENVRNMKARVKLNQQKKKPKNVNKRQIKKPNKKPPFKKAKKPVKKPINRAIVKTTKNSGESQYLRNKRDITVVQIQGSSAESINMTDTVALTVIPVTSNSFVPDDRNVLHAIMANTTFPDNIYYKYTVVSEQPRAKLDEPIGDKANTQFNKTETVFNLIDTQLNSNVTTEKRHIKNNEANKNINFTETNPEENELKYSKWYNLKIIKEGKNISEPNIKEKRFMKLMSHANKTIFLENKNRSHKTKVEKKRNYRKYNMVKLLNHSKCRFDNCLTVNNSINMHMSSKSNGDLHGYLTKILNKHHKNSTSSPFSSQFFPRRRKTGVLKYLKGIFNKIFKGKRTPDKMSKHQVIDTLCKNFGPCLKLTREDKVVLNSKLSDLDKETARILKTVKIIKGLLKLLELPKSVNSDFSKKEHFRNDMQKLNNILKGNYSGNGSKSMTETQLTQIEYVKRSTQDFIQSVNKFASLLNEIIAMLTKENKNRFRNKPKNNLMNKNLSKDDPFQSLRNLLLRYNLVQNTFMKQMYEQLNNFENQFNEKPKVSEVKELNNSVAIENISRNIIHNLRKLKHLVQVVSYKGRGSGRTKREIGRDDEAVEYLLVLMEYLIKQHHPLDAEPVNDGIDLLIEAIKNAPDIKPIKKKVLEYTPAIYTDSTTTTTSTSPRTPSTAISEDTLNDDESPSESDKMSSSEDSKNKQEENETKFKENNKFVDTVTDDEKEFEGKFQFDRRAETDKMEEITEMTLLSKFKGEDNMTPELEDIFETTTFRNTILPLETEIRDKLDRHDDLKVEKTLATESNNLDKPMDYNDAGGKKIEVFTGDLDDENILSNTVTTESNTATSIALPTTTELLIKSFQAQKSRTKMRYHNLETYDNDSSDEKSKLTWIEENFGKENAKRFTDFIENNSTQATPVTGTIITANSLEKVGVISITRDKAGKSKKVDETEKNKHSVKLSAEEIMFRKQMELLNSLDYGTERAEVLESDSKDSNVEERDSFPSYFV